MGLRLARTLLIAIILIGAVLQNIMPACGLYWPIMGFLPPDGGCPNICGGPSLPPPYDAMTPGTFQWGYPPIDRARQVYPGCAYGPKAFQNDLSFGSSLPFGSHRPGLYAPQGPAPGTEAVSAGNETAAVAGHANNTTRSAGNKTGNAATGRGGNSTSGWGPGTDGASSTGSLFGWLSSR